MFRFAALRHPEHAALIARVLAVPTKRYDRAIVSYLTPKRSTRSWPHPTAPAGSAVATTR